MRSMQNRISYSVAVAMSPETLQNDVVSVADDPVTLIGNCRGHGKIYQLNMFSIKLELISVVENLKGGN